MRGLETRKARARARSACLVVICALAHAPNSVAAPSSAPPGRVTSAQLLLESASPRSYESLRPRIAGLAVAPARHTTRPLTLVERPIVLDFHHQSFVLGYRTQHDDRSEPAPAPGFPNLVFETRAKLREGFLDYRRRVFEDYELGIDVPWLGLEEARPTRILPLATAPSFTAVEDDRSSSGLGDIRLSLARGWNRPGLSRRLGLSVKLDNGSTSIPDARSLPLGSGQKDYTLSYGVKRTRGSFALTGIAGLELRDEGAVPTFAGGQLLYRPGNEAFLTVRADKRLRQWWTGSLSVTSLASQRDSIAGSEVPGTSRQLIAVTPIVTYQASEVFEVIADVTYSPLAHHVTEAPVYGLALRWRH